MGIAVTFGLMGYLNMQLNPANLMAVPMILGIGVDYSVYIVHEYLEQKGRYRMSPGTAIAVTVDSLTTLIGYGSLLIASHRGLHSLGQVLTLAVTFCTLMSVVVLPAFLVWITRNRPLVPWVGDAVESLRPRRGGRAIDRAGQAARAGVYYSPGGLGGDRHLVRAHDPKWRDALPFGSRLNDSRNATKAVDHAQ